MYFKGVTLKQFYLQNNAHVESILNELLIVDNGINSKPVTYKNDFDWILIVE